MDSVSTALPASLDHALLTGTVSHKRHWPRENAFQYGVYYLSPFLDALPAFDGLRLLSRNRFNLFSLNDRDHGARDRTRMKDWARDILARFDIAAADGDICLVTLPRVLGHVFNPVSFWFCLDRNGALRAVISEVNNTFNDTHAYVSFHDDFRVIGRDDILQARKVFHVSPFMDVTGHYTFRFSYANDKIGVWINHYEGERLMLSTALTGKRGILSDKRLLKCFFAYPLVTFKVIGLIHWQAVLLLLKGMKYRPRPQPPQEGISR